MFLVAAATCLALLCVGFKYLTTMKLRARDVFFLVWIAVLLMQDILKDFLTDFWKNKDEPVALPGVLAVITGGARGIGVEVVKKLMRSDVFVVVGCRNLIAGEQVLQQVRELGVSSGGFKCYKLDLNSMSSVQEFADSVLHNHGEIHILVNNAGITAETRKLTEDGVESTFSVNYLGHYYLAHLLLPRLVSTARTTGRQVRVVNVVSCVHSYRWLGELDVEDLTLRNNYQEYHAYSRSKMAQVMFTKTLDAKLKASGLPVQVYAVHPGVVFTGIISQNIFHWVLPWVLPLVLRTPEEGARSVYYACASPQLQSRSGSYITSCEVSPTGGASNSEHAQKQLWDSTMNLLHLETFGGLFQ